MSTIVTNHVCTVHTATLMYYTYMVSESYIHISVGITVRRLVLVPYVPISDESSSAECRYLRTNIAALTQSS
jgi:hypothetical protein